MDKTEINNNYVKLCTELGELEHKKNLINARVDQLKHELVSITAVYQKLNKQEPTKPE